ncbi:MAG: FAD-dependent thymidylate synthase [Magnetococcales bacterium]|nr:FAD-dependent thymidylate synthase [Magnetococcales bacterium]
MERPARDPLPTTADDATREIEADVATRLAENPDFTCRVGNFGFIELEESWGDEATIINTARVSTSNQRVADVAAFTDRERQLLYHLLAHNHGTPFETVHFRWRVIAPIFVLRQWMRHRIGSFNEFSQRYRQPISAYFIPDREARTVGGVEVMSEAQLAEYCRLMDSLQQFYERSYAETCARLAAAEEGGLVPRLAGGRNPYRARARELLRNAMPVATYSDIYWTVNFRSLMNFFDLRRKPEAQTEIRQYADAAYAMFLRRFPLLGATMNRVLAEKGGEHR